MSANHINFELLEYFKKGFEPDPLIFAVLERNIKNKKNHCLF